jgi:hypothetical protein
VNESGEEGVSVGMRGKQPVGDASFGFTSDGFDDAPVEAFDEAVGLRPEGLCQAVIDRVLGADTVERMPAGGSISRLASSGP